MATKTADGPKARYARVKIEYNKDKPKISFSYPTKDGRTGDMFSVIQEKWLMCLAGLLLISLIVWGIYYSLDDSIKLDNSDVTMYDDYSIENFTMCALNHSTETILNYSNMKENICAPDGIKIKMSFIYSILGILFFALTIIFLPPFIIYYPFRKKWDKLFPAYAAWIAEKKIVIFKSADVQPNLLKHDKDHSYFVEIPVFENVICDFKCKGAFSDYLKEVEIREHNFKYYKALKKGKRRKHTAHETNELLWYARFYFSDKPMSGNLVVIFK